MSENTDFMAGDIVRVVRSDGSVQQWMFCHETDHPGPSGEPGDHETRVRVATWSDRYGWLYKEPTLALFLHWQDGGNATSSDELENHGG